MERLTVSKIAAEELVDLNAYVVVMQELDNQGGERIELSRSILVDDQDRRLGLDTYSITTSTGATHYGGITSCVLIDRTLRIDIDADASNELGINGGYEILLDVDEYCINLLKAGLLRILAAERGGKAPFLELA